ncbi:MAG: choice-of-anchor tandem repeat GloVer-containing protein [Candidatus Korobacteraceae bacterium]
MKALERHSRLLCGYAAAALAMVLTLAAVTTQAAQAQTYSVIYDFTGGANGAMPMAGLTYDGAGSFYGTANYGGNTGGNCGTNGCGLVYRLTNTSSGWALTPLYSFLGGNDGANPEIAYVVFGPDGSLYSTTYYGGGTCDGIGCGTAFKLRPSAADDLSGSSPWVETVLHRFTGADGAGPVGAVIFDHNGNMDGATSSGGLHNGGIIYQLNASRNWDLVVMYHPYGYPGSGLTMNHAGDLYGTTFNGGHDLFGSVYQLTPSGSGWIETDLYDFTNGSDGSFPQAGVILDGAGNLYGATSVGGTSRGGTVFELTNSNGSWVYNKLYSLTGPVGPRLVVGPIGNLVMDAAGNLYGTALADGAHGYGSVFKLTPSHGSWTYTSLHDFTNGSDGGYPYSTLVLDPSGNLYGTASSGGTQGVGVVFEITP